MIHIWGTFRNVLDLTKVEDKKPKDRDKDEEIKTEFSLFSSADFHSSHFILCLDGLFVRRNY